MADHCSTRVAGPGQRPAGRPQVSAVLPNLLIGEHPTPGDAAWLRRAHGVTSVVCLQDEFDLASRAIDLPTLRQAYDACAIRFHHTPLPDGDLAGIAARLDAIVALIGDLIRAGHRVYLHCTAGMNRAPTVAIAYLHAHGGLCLGAARDLVKQRRACVPYMQLLEAHYGAPPTA